MQKKTLAKRLAVGFMAALVSVSLLAGCGGGKDKGAGAQNDPPKMVIPAREPVSTAPTITFKFGETEAKVYELTGVDLTKSIRTGKIVTCGDAIFFHTDSANEADNHQHLRRVTVKHETISDLTDMGQSGDIAELATNGKLVIWQSSREVTQKDKLMIYDGKDIKEGGKWWSRLIGDPDSDNFYYMYGDDLTIAKLENNELKDAKVVLKDMQSLPGYENAGLGPVCVFKDEIYIRRVTRKDDKDSHVLVAFNKNDGKELRQYDGLSDLPRGWAVTENYVIHSGSKGDFRVFDRQTGKIIGDAKINIRPFALWTSKGNDVIVYDDRAKKLYRIDF